jgi:hypothetical protein
VQIACDESGYEGERLVGTTTALFAHASVALDLSTAAECLRSVRERIGSPAVQYKANHLQRERHRPVLEWLLGPAAPLLSNAHVFLLDKAAYLTRLSGGVEGSPAAVNDLLRAGGRARTEPPQQSADVREAASIDPLIPAILHAVEHWAVDGPVTILHDRQRTLTPARVRWLMLRCGGRLAGLSFAGAAADPRIQLADILAGTVRSIMEGGRAGRPRRPDARLVALAEPYLTA